MGGLKHSHNNYAIYGVCLATEISITFYAKMKGNEPTILKLEQEG